MTLNAWLAQNNITVTEFADELGYHRNTISRICNGGSCGRALAQLIEIRTSGQVDLFGGGDILNGRGFSAARKLGYVIVLCHDFERMKQLYTDLFGFEVEDEEPGHWIGFRVGSLFLGLRPRGRPYDGPKIGDASAAIQLSFHVSSEDVDVAYQTLVERGIDIIEEPTNQDWPHRTLFFSDPENNIIEIFADIHPRDTATAPSGIHRAAGR